MFSTSLINSLVVFCNCTLNISSSYIQLSVSFDVGILYWLIFFRIFKIHTCIPFFACCLYDVSLFSTRNSFLLAKLISLSSLTVLPRWSIIESSLIFSSYYFAFFSTSTSWYRNYYVTIFGYRIFSHWFYLFRKIIHYPYFHSSKIFRLLKKLIYFFSLFIFNKIGLVLYTLYLPILLTCWMWTGNTKLLLFTLFFPKNLCKR